MAAGKKRKKRLAKAPARARRASGAIEIFSDSLKATFDFKIFVAPLMAIVFGIAAAIIILAISIPFVLAGIGFAASGSAGVAPLIAVVTIGGLVFLALAIASSAIVSAFYYISIDEYLAGKKISIEKNIGIAIAGWKRLAGVYIIEALVGLVIAALVIMPTLAFAATSLAISQESVAAAISSNSLPGILSALAPAFIVLGAAFASLMAIMFFINPLLFLWFPTAVFEKKPVMECVSRGYLAGKAKYLRNLCALLLMGILGAIVAAFQMLDPTFIIGIILGIWLELATVVMIIKIYREGA